MNTITDKLNYLSETKDLFKNRLVSLGAEITNQTTFRNYLNWVKNLYSEVSNKTRLAREGIEGNTYQETNANVFDDTLTQTTYTSTGAVVENSPTIFNFINGYTYTINIKFTSNNVSTTNQNRILGIRTYKDIGYAGRGVIISSDNLSSGTGSITFTAEENYNRFSFINYADFQSGTITITDFEIITNTPTPDYPQEIVNISGKSTLKDAGKNLFDKDSEDVGYVYSNTGSYASSRLWNTSDWISVESNSQYTLSFKTTGTANLFFSEFNKNKEFIQRTITGTLTPTSNTKYVKISYKNDIGTYDIQLEKGSTASDYEPYQEQSFDLDLKSKNLFDKDNVKGSYDANATLMTIQLQPNTQYTFSRIVNTTFARDNGYYLYFVKNEDTSTRIFDLMHLSMTDPITSGTETITTGASGIIKLIGVYAYPERVQNYFNNVNVQIEEGPTATDYEPYYDINLCKIENYKDRIYPLNGKWYLEKKIGKVVLTGDSSESYSLSSNTDVIYYQSAINVGNSSNILSNYYFYSSFINLYNATVDYAISYNTSNNLLAIRNKNMSSANDFKTWLSTHNTIVYYPLETPTTEEITESNYPTLYNQLNSIQDYLIKYKINKEFMLEYSEPTIEIESEEN